MNQHTHPAIFFNRIIAVPLMQGGGRILWAGGLMQTGGAGKKLEGTHQRVYRVPIRHVSGYPSVTLKGTHQTR